ncbi:MAG TPA: TonB family protein [Xanthobacteraceae bacterium]|nr:TonB family protein [Xanthobacteraceae bacterium]
MTLASFEEHSPRELARWAVAAAIVGGVHAATVAFFLGWQQPAEVGDDAEAMTVELAPIDSTPDAAASDAAPAPETMIERKAPPAPPQQKQTEAIERPPEEAPAQVTEPVAKTSEKVEAALPPAPRTAQQVRGGAPRVEPSWQTSLMRQLERHKRYPNEAQSRSEQGVVLLNFSLDRAGHVLARRIARSSGFADLDNEAMAMILRAAPLPPFPPSMPELRLDLVVPIRFALR